MCYLWRLDILLMHVVSDLVIGFAYFSIPLVLWIFAVRRPDLIYRPVAYLFIAFIVFCGATHFLAVYTVWVPAYFLEGLFKVGTALASVGTAIALWPLLPRALAIPSVKQLEATNATLRSEVSRRTAAEDKLTRFAGDLERTVESRTRELRKSNEILKDFAAGASHDLKAPIRQVALLTDMTLRDKDSTLSDTARGYLDEAKAKSEGMLDLVDTLLRYSVLVEATPEKAQIELAAFVKRFADAFASNRGGQLDIAVIGEAQILGDPTLLRQLFHNLLENACKYAVSDAIKIEIEIRQTPMGTSVAVRDNGPGIAPEYAEGIFKMLQRYRTDVAGAGVGLAFCRRIMEAHGGLISLDTSYQSGASFTLEFPDPTSRLNS